MAGGIDCGYPNLFFCLWHVYLWMVLYRLSFGFPLQIYQGWSCLLFGRYSTDCCSVFLSATNFGPVYLLLRWYCVGCYVVFPCVLSLGYCHVTMLTLSVYRISSVSIMSCCYTIVPAPIPVASEAHPGNISLWRFRLNLSSWILTMDIWITVFIQHMQCHRDVHYFAATYMSCRSRLNTFSSGMKDIEGIISRRQSEIAIIILYDKDYGD
jgi:hypothetical protein